MRPGFCWEKWSSPLQAGPKVKWGRSWGETEKPPNHSVRKLFSNETQHCCVSHAPRSQYHPVIDPPIS